MKKIIIFILLLMVLFSLHAIDFSSEVVDVTQLGDLGWSILPVGAHVRFQPKPSLKLLENNNTSLYLDLWGGYKTGYTPGWNPILNKIEIKGFGKVESGFNINFGQGFLKNKFGGDFILVSLGNTTISQIATDYLSEYTKNSPTFPITNTDFSTKPWFKELTYSRKYLTTSFYSRFLINSMTSSWEYREGFLYTFTGLYGLGNLFDTSSKFHHYGGFDTSLHLYFPIVQKRYKFKNQEYNLFSIIFQINSSFEFREGGYVPSNLYNSNMFKFETSAHFIIMGPHILMYDTYPMLYLSAGIEDNFGYQTNSHHNKKTNYSDASVSAYFDMKLINIIHIGYKFSFKLTSKTWDNGLVFYVKI